MNFCRDRKNERLDARVFRGDFSRNSGYRSALEISRHDPLPTAVLAASENSDPGLTTIGQDANAIGESAVLNILDRIAGGKAEKTYLIEPALVIRESVGRIIR
jgi:DNA-binding LacI/PurR family transcriptional regulator